MIWNLNESYTSFVSRFGIEPNGLLMSEDTFFNLYEAKQIQFDHAGNNPKFMGLAIYRSHQMKPNEIKFVI